MTATSPAGCIFCGQRPLAQEHVWPGRLKQELPGLEASLHTLADRARPDATHAFVRDAFTQTVGSTCAACNGHLERTIERPAMPYLIPLLQGRPSDLDAEGQRRIAAYGMRVAVIAQYLQPNERMRPIPKAHLDTLHQQAEPPPQAQIWLAQFNGRDIGPKLYLNPLGFLVGDEDRMPARPNAYGVAMRAGELVWLIFSLHLDARLPIEPGAVGFTVRIWPVESGVAKWPPEVSLNDEGWEAARHVFDQPFEAKNIRAEI